MTFRGGLRYLVPVILDLTAPELPDLLLIGSRGGASVHSQGLDFVEVRRILGTGQGRRRPRAELPGAAKPEGCDAGPLGEGGTGEIRRSRLVLPRLYGQIELGLRSPRSVLFAQLQDGMSHRATDADACRLAGSNGDIGEILLQLRIKCRLEARVQRDEHVVRRAMRSRLLRGIVADTLDFNEGGSVIAINRVHGIIDGRVQDSEVAGRMDSCRLSSCRSNNRQ